MDGDWTVVLSFIGTLGALMITKTVERVYTQTVQRAERSRDLILHLADTLLAVERFISPLVAPCDIRDSASLRRIDSSFTWSPLPLKVESLLDVFSEPETHRLIYKFFDRDSLCRQASAEHETAYYWLLDNAKDWTADDAQERVGAIRESRTRMLRYTQEMLSTGYQLLERLHPLANNVVGNLTRGDAAAFYKYLEFEHQLTKAGIGLRRAYYEARFTPPTPFRPHEQYGLAVLADQRIGAALRERRGGVTVLVRSADGASEARVAIRPFKDFALPEGSVIREITIWVETDSGQPLRHSAPLDRALGPSNRVVPLPLAVPPEVTRLLPE